MREGNAAADGHTDRHPYTAGGITRLAYARAKAAGIALDPLLRAAGLTPHQIEDPRNAIKVRDQIEFLNLAAIALEDDLLGFHLAQTADLRELGLLYYVSRLRKNSSTHCKELHGTVPSLTRELLRCIDVGRFAYRFTLLESVAIWIGTRSNAR